MLVHLLLVIMWPSQLKVCWEWLKLKQPPSIIDSTTIFYESFFYYLHILIFGLLQLKHFFPYAGKTYLPVYNCMFSLFFFNWPCFWSPTSYLYSVPVYRSAHFILREKCQLFVNSSNTLSVLVSNFFILDLEIGPFWALSNRYIMI